MHSTLNKDLRATAHAIHRRWVLAGTSAVLAVLAGASVPASAAGMADIGMVEPGLAFPDPQAAWRSGGIVVNRDNLHNVVPGLTKDQVANLLGRPHFSEGIFSVHVWDYILNFRTRDGAGLQACQYQIRFDRDYRLSRSYWRTDECARLARDAGA